MGPKLLSGCGRVQNCYFNNGQDGQVYINRRSTPACDRQTEMWQINVVLNG